MEDLRNRINVQLVNSEVVKCKMYIKTKLHVAQNI